MVICLYILYELYELYDTDDDTDNDINEDNIEGFDARLLNLTKEQCGKLCTSIIGCQGFSYNDKNQCYLSKSPILTKPVNSLFTDEYNSAFYRCNKAQPIIDETDIVSPDLLKRNALYLCSDNERGQYDFTIISEHKVAKVGDFNELDKVNIPDYVIIDDFVWPKVKQDTVLKKGKRNIDKFMLYEKANDEYLGGYLFDHKCSSNINLTPCMQTCENDDRCVGVEWNPYYVKNDGNNKTSVYRNICCPKTQITEIIPRRTEYQNGNFYIKKLVDQFDKNKIYILNKDQTTPSDSINFSR